MSAPDVESSLNGAYKISTSHRLNETFSVISRSGDKRQFSQDRIQRVLEKAFLAVHGEQARLSQSQGSIIEHLLQDILNTIEKNYFSSGQVAVESIQEIVVRTLMASQQFKVAEAYILYRNRRAQERSKKTQKVIHLQGDDGEKTPIQISLIETNLSQLCQAIPDVSPSIVIKQAYASLYDGISSQEVIDALILSARAMIEKEPNYGYVASKVLWYNLHCEAFAVFGIQMPSMVSEQIDLAFDDQAYFKAYFASIIKLI